MTADRMSANQAGLAAIRTEFDGIWRIGLYPRAAIAGIAAAANNDAAARVLSNAVTAYTQSIRDRPATDQAQCLTCETTFDRRHLPEGLSTLRADVSAARRYMVGGLCRECWQRPGIRDLVRVAYGATMGVDIRIINVGAAGHA
jgi:hypothetical protein